MADFGITEDLGDTSNRVNPVQAAGSESDDKKRRKNLLDLAKEGKGLKVLNLLRQYLNKGRIIGTYVQIKQIVPSPTGLNQPLGFP